MTFCLCETFRVERVSFSLRVLVWVRSCRTRVSKTQIRKGTAGHSSWLLKFIYPFTLNNTIKTGVHQRFSCCCLNLAASHYTLAANRTHLAARRADTSRKKSGSKRSDQAAVPRVIPNHFHVNPAASLIVLCNTRINRRIPRPSFRRVPTGRLQTSRLP